MSFGNSVIYPFPAVQYIPMPVVTLEQGELKNLDSKQPRLICGLEINKHLNMIRKADFEQFERITKDSFPILAVNLQIIEAKYRSFFVTLIGQEKQGYYQLFTIPKRYFYKQKLYFAAFSKETSQVIARFSFFMPKIS